MSTKPVLTGIAVMLSVWCWCQLSDDFSDGDLSSNPVWRGDTSDFLVTNDLELQLSASNAGTSLLYVEVDFPDSVEWMVDFRMEFAPSEANHLRIYLAASSQNPFSGDAYFLKIGEDGASDALEFYAQIAGFPVLLGRGGDGLFAQAPVNVCLKVERDRDARWTILADFDMLQNWTTILELQDASFRPDTGQFLAISCSYSASRKDKFFFDNIFVQEIIPDTTPPEISQVSAFAERTLLLEVNEAIGPASVQTPQHYHVDNGIGSAATADFLSPASILLEFLSPFEQGEYYVLTAVKMTDLAGNVAEERSLGFRFILPREPLPYEVLISELLPDPQPQIGLPAGEFVELQNRSHAFLDIRDMTFETLSDVVRLPAFIMEPGSFLILTAEEHSSSFASYGPVVGIADFPNLPNQGTTVVLRTKHGDFVHALQYDLSSYRNSAKDDGGWTLELIAPGFPCNQRGNLGASEAPTGGSPGRRNSLYDPGLDNAGPVLHRVFPPTDTTLSLYFNENLHPTHGLQLSHITIDPGVSITGLTLSAHDPARAELQIAPFSFEMQTQYTLEISEVLDCAGNPSQLQPLPFGLPETPDSADLVINEVLFDPETGGSQFVELYNRSDKVINAGSLFLGEFLSGPVDAESIDANYLILPRRFIVLTPSPEDIQTRYHVRDPVTLISAGIPNFPRDKGNITLYTRDFTIDRFNYSDALHTPLLDDTKGVSLERIDPEISAIFPGNWHSASEASGYATPGYKNSQFTALLPANDKPYALASRTISPDGDGIQDVLLIRFLSDTPGSSLRMIVFDSSGRKIKEIARNAFLGSETLLQWDGTDESGQLPGTGIYILWSELTTSAGQVQKFKDVVVLAARL